MATIVTGSPQRHFLRDVRKWIGETDQIVRRIASRSGASRRAQESQREPRKQGGGGHRCLEPLSGMVARPNARPRYLNSAAAIGWRLFGLGSRDHEIGQQPTYAIMNSLGYVKFFCCRV